MIIIETEAHNVTCPFLSHPGIISNVVFNGCEGRNCMMWRWYKDKNGNTGVIGYCGLAGKPDDSALTGT